jgi:hypothetical protein
MTERVPIYINNRNRLSTTWAMIEYLQDVPGALPIIVDNASTYEPLLDWYARCGVEIVYCRNRGPRAPWLVRHVLMTQCAYYVVTDSDLDLTAVPIDVLDVLREGLERYPDRIKAGLSLETYDLPQHFASTSIVQAWERKYWIDRLDARWWNADVDTTFALYRVGAEFPGIRPALRADRPYTARHVPWYRGESEEDRYYEQHANPQWSTWSNWDAPLETQPARKYHIDTLARHES